MAYDKTKSGDPDFDDKVPPAEHARVVKAGDGTEYAYHESTGPTDRNGAHINPDGPDPADLDTRPAPGEVATERAPVQVADPDAAPKATEAEIPTEPQSVQVEDAKVAKPQAEPDSGADPAAKPATRGRAGK